MRRILDACARRAHARAESWAALCVAAGQGPPSPEEWARLGVEPRPTVACDREFAYGGIEADGLGLLAAGRIREDEHVALVRDVARLLIDAGERQAAYFGRSAAGLVDTCSRVVKIVDQNLAGLEAAVAARHIREQAHS